MCQQMVWPMAGRGVAFPMVEHPCPPSPKEVQADVWRTLPISWAVRTPSQVGTGKPAVVDPAEFGVGTGVRGTRALWDPSSVDGRCPALGLAQDRAGAQHCSAGGNHPGCQINRIKKRYNQEPTCLIPTSSQDGCRLWKRLKELREMNKNSPVTSRLRYAVLAPVPPLEKVCSQSGALVVTLVTLGAWMCLMA